MINNRGHGNNIVDILNATEIKYLKDQMECDGRLKINDTSNILILPCYSKVLPSTFCTNIYIFSLISIKLIYLKYLKMKICKYWYKKLKVKL